MIISFLVARKIINELEKMTKVLIQVVWGLLACTDNKRRNRKKILNKIVKPTLKELRKRKKAYKGFFYMLV